MQGIAIEAGNGWNERLQEDQLYKDHRTGYCER